MYDSPLSFVDLHGLDVLVCNYPSNPGHVGFGPSKGGGGTSGFYPQPGASRIGAGLGQWVPGEIRPDKPEKDMQCKVLSADDKQDNCMARCQARRKGTPGPYHFTGRNCVDFVRDCLNECGIPSGSSWDKRPGGWFNSLKGAK